MTRPNHDLPWSSVTIPVFSRLVVALFMALTLHCILSEPVMADDCFARLMRGEWNNGDCGNTNWDEMAPIFAFAAVVAAVAAAVVVAAVAPGLAMAVGAAMTAHAVSEGFKKDGIRGVINEFSPHNDFINAYNATNGWDRARHILTGGLKTLGLIPFLRPATRMARGALRGLGRAGGRAARMARGAGRTGSRVGQTAGAAGRRVPRARRPASTTRGQGQESPRLGSGRGNQADDPLYQELLKVERAEREAARRAARMRQRHRQNQQQSSSTRTQSQKDAEKAWNEKVEKAWERWGRDRAQRNRQARQEAERVEKAAQQAAKKKAQNQRTQEQAPKPKPMTRRERQMAHEKAQQEAIRARRHRQGAGINNKHEAPMQSTTGGSTPRQIQKNSCALNSLEACAREQGLAPRSQGENIANAMKNRNFDPNSGMGSGQIAAEARARGMNAHVTRDPNQSTIEHVLRNAHPDGKSVIMGVKNGGGGGHAVKFEGFNASGRKVIFSDPWTGEFHSVPTKSLKNSVYRLIEVWK